MAEDACAPNDYRRAIFEWAHSWPPGGEARCSDADLEALDAAIQKCVRDDHDRMRERNRNLEAAINRLESTLEQRDEQIQVLKEGARRGEELRIEEVNNRLSLEEQLAREQGHRDEWALQLVPLREEATAVLDNKTRSHVNAARTFATALVGLVGRHTPPPSKPPVDPPITLPNPDNMHGAADGFGGQDPG